MPPGPRLQGESVASPQGWAVREAFLWAVVLPCTRHEKPPRNSRQETHIRSMGGPTLRMCCQAREIYGIALVWPRNLSARPAGRRGVVRRGVAVRLLPSSKVIDMK